MADDQTTTDELPRFDKGLSPAQVKVLRHYGNEARIPWKEVNDRTLRILIEHELMLPSGEHLGPQVTAKGRIALAQIAGREPVSTSEPDTSIYLEPVAGQPHRWTLWFADTPVPFGREFDLYTALDIAARFLKATHGLDIQWHGPIPPDYSRYYAARGDQ